MLKAAVSVRQCKTRVPKQLTRQEVGERRARVRGHVGRGDKPHISFYHVRYTSEQLARTPELIGKRLRIYYDADDIRVLRAFLADSVTLRRAVVVCDATFSRSAHTHL